jgi:hypothetical protein
MAEADVRSHARRVPVRTWKIVKATRVVRKPARELPMHSILAKDGYQVAFNE